MGLLSGQLQDSVEAGQLYRKTGGGLWVGTACLLDGAFGD